MMVPPKSALGAATLIVGVAGVTVIEIAVG